MDHSKTRLKKIPGSLRKCWDWLSDIHMKRLALMGGFLLVLAGGAWRAFIYFSTATSPEMSVEDVTVTGGTAIFTPGPVTIDDISAKAVATQLLKSHERELGAYQQREQQYQDQIRSLTEAVKALVAEKVQGDAPAGIDAALKQLQEGKTDAAESIFRQILKRKAAEGEAANKEAAEAARHLGALAFLHDTERALSAYRRATELDPDDWEGWNQLGHLKRRIGQLIEAKVAYEKVVTLGELTKNNYILSIGYSNLGILYETRGDLDEAESMYRKSLEIDEALGFKVGMARHYTNLGIVYMTRGDLDEAESVYRKSLEIDEALGRKEGMASDYNNLGMLYTTRGDLDEAESMHRKSLEIAEALGHKEGMANNYGNLGILYETRGDLDEAESMHRKSLEINEALGRRKSMARDYSNLGILYKTRGNLHEAESMYRKSLEINEALGRREGIATNYANLGNLHMIRGNLDEAESMYRKALKLFQELDATPRVEQLKDLLELLSAGKK